MKELDNDTGFGARTGTCIEGRRVDGLSGAFGGVLVRNDEEFHWCISCAIIAFKAVEDAAAS